MERLAKVNLTSVIVSYHPLRKFGKGKKAETGYGEYCR